MIEVLFSLLSR